MQEPTKASRRAFLRGEAVRLDPTGGELPSSTSASRVEFPHDSPTALDPTTAPYLVSVGRRAMACQFQVFLNAGQYENATKAAIGALDHVDQLESQLTVYQDDSEVSRINEIAYQAALPIEENLFGLLKLALKIYQQTDGAFDITAGALWDIWKSAQRNGAIPNSQQIEGVLKHVGSKRIQLDENDQTIRLTRSSVQINLGGIGKGYALDCGAELLTRGGVNDFLFHGGQSSVVARGKRSDPGEHETGWNIGVVHPGRPDRRLAVVRLKDRALSTSGSLTQSFHFQGRRYGHILDPRSGRPAEGVLSATVLANEAAVADALSTAMFVLGPKGAQDYCDQHPDVGVILVLPALRGGKTEIESYNLDAEDWQLIDE